MLITNYLLPFSFEVSTRNPWDGQRSVDLWVETVGPLSDEKAEALESYVAPFELGGSSGAWGGTVFPPWESTVDDPTFLKRSKGGVFTFPPGKLDERASHCLLSLLLVAHSDVAPIKSAGLRANGLTHAAIAVDKDLDNPYPPLAPNLPFPYVIEDSESDYRVLRVRFRMPVEGDEKSEEVAGEILGLGVGLTVGAYGVAPTPPEECGCIPNGQGEWDDDGGEVFIWELTKCAFHPAALDGLVSLCGRVHHDLAEIAEVHIE